MKSAWPTCTLLLTGVCPTTCKSTANGRRLWHEVCWCWGRGIGIMTTQQERTSTLCMVFDRCYHFLSPLFLFFGLWSRKLHFRHSHRYFLDIYDTLEQSKELSRRGFWLDDRCLKKRTIGFTLLLHSVTLAEEVLRTSSSAKDPELTWIFFQPFLEESRNVDK